MNISARFDRFIANIRPTREQREDADRQVTFLREHLIERITDDARFHLEKIFHAGSAAKHTDLAPRGKGTFRNKRTGDTGNATSNEPTICD